MDPQTNPSAAELVEEEHTIATKTFAVTMKTYHGKSALLVRLENFDEG